MNLNPYLIIGIPMLAISACNKPPSDNAAGASPSASATPVTDEALDQARIPVKEDYEEQAQKTVTSENLDEQLDQLEKQITADR